MRQKYSFQEIGRKVEHPVVFILVYALLQNNKIACMFNFENSQFNFDESNERSFRHFETSFIVVLNDC